MLGQVKWLLACAETCGCAAQLQYTCITCPLLRYHLLIPWIEHWLFRSNRFTSPCLIGVWRVVEGFRVCDDPSADDIPVKFRRSRLSSVPRVVCATTGHSSHPITPAPHRRAAPLFCPPFPLPRPHRLPTLSGGRAGKLGPLYRQQRSRWRGRHRRRRRWPRRPSSPSPPRNRSRGAPCITTAAPDVPTAGSQRSSVRPAARQHREPWRWRCRGAPARGYGGRTRPCGRERHANSGSSTGNNDGGVGDGRSRRRGRQQWSWRWCGAAGGDNVSRGAFGGRA